MHHETTDTESAERHTQATAARLSGEIVRIVRQNRGKDHGVRGTDSATHMMREWVKPDAKILATAGNLWVTNRRAACSETNTVQQVKWVM